MKMERDSHTRVQRQIDDDLRNEEAFLWFDPTLDLQRNELADVEEEQQPPIVLCEECGSNTFGQFDGDITQPDVVGECDHCGSEFNYSFDDSRIISMGDDNE